MEISETDVQSAEEIKETLPPMAADNPEQIRRERKTPATVGKKLFRQTLGKGLPKRWKGGGDYFFEQQEDGSLKITGGDKARTLTGGKSVVITDSEKLKEIYEKAHGGDMLEADVTYKAEEKEASWPGSSVSRPAEELGVNLKDRLETSTPEAEGIPRVYDGMEEEKGTSDLKETPGVLRPKREYRNPTMEAANYLLTVMRERPELAEQLQRAIDALGVDVQSAERVEEEGV